MPSELGKKGLEKGLITQKQYDKLPAHLLDAIVKKKMKTGGGKKPKAKAPIKQARASGSTRKAKPSGPKPKGRKK